MPHGLVDVASYEAEQRSGGFGSPLRTAGEEAVRKVASGAAVVARAVTPDTRAGLTGLEPGQVDRFSTGAAPAGNVGLEGVFSPEARERRKVHPTAAALGGSVPAVAAGLPLPGAGVAGVLATIGIDAVDAAAQAALDAELENRDIRGEDVLRNAAIDLLFSGSAAELGAGAPAWPRGARSTAHEVLPC